MSVPIGLHLQHSRLNHLHNEISYFSLFLRTFLFLVFQALRQRCGSGSPSGSVGSICFWASRIRIRIINQRYGSGSFYHHAKIVRKTLIPTVLWLLNDLLSLKNDVNVPSKSNKQKNYCGRLEDHWKKQQDLDPDPLVRGTGMDPQIRIRTRISWIRNTALRNTKPNRQLVGQATCIPINRMLKKSCLVYGTVLTFIMEGPQSVSQRGQWYLSISAAASSSIFK